MQLKKATITDNTFTPSFNIGDEVEISKLETPIPFYYYIDNGEPKVIKNNDKSNHLKYYAVREDGVCGHVSEKEIEIIKTQ